MQLENTSGDWGRNRAQIRQRDFRSRNRGEAGEILVVAYRFCQDRWADAVDSDPTWQFDGRRFYKTFDQVVDCRSDGAAMHVFIGQNTRYQGERTLVGNERKRNPDQVDLALYRKGL